MVELRKTLLLPLNDLRAVTHEFIHPAVSRSGLDRCLRRHGISTLKALMPQEEGAKTPVKTFKAYAPGFVHVDSNTCRRCRTRSNAATCSLRFDTPPNT